MQHQSFQIANLRNYLEKQKVSGEIIFDIELGQIKNSMPIKLTNYLMSLIDFNSFIEDPIRKQFLPFMSEFQTSHPMSLIDSLGEENSEVYDGIIHRYPTKLLFMIGVSCPSYCAFCTRSYAVGTKKGFSKKHITKPLSNRIEFLNLYFEKNPQINDIVISGGDISDVKIDVIEQIFEAIQKITTLRSIRIGTRGFLFCPDLFLPNTPMFNLLLKYSKIFQKQGKELSLQTHFNHPCEISNASEKSINYLMELGIVFRNQTVILKNINTDKTVMIDLVDKLINTKILPYYVFHMDSIPYAEHYRTTLKESIAVESEIMGRFPGFLTPRFSIDLPAGGGKKNLSSYSAYDDEKGRYLFKSPLINPQKDFFYYDPLHSLSPRQKEYWEKFKLVYYNE